MSISFMKEEKQHIMKVLPLLLKKDPQFQTEVYRILMETCGTKEDFTQKLEEPRVSREETNKKQ